MSQQSQIIICQQRLNALIASLLAAGLTSEVKKAIEMRHDLDTQLLQLIEKRERGQQHDG